MNPAERRSNASSPPPDAAPVFGKGARRQAWRAHVGVLLFFVIDALLLTGYGVIGTIAPHLGWLYGLVGCAASASMIAVFWWRGGRVVEHEWLTIVLCAFSSLVMLTMLGVAPQVGGLMLMSIMAVVALSALQLKSAMVFAFCIVLPAAGLLVIGSTGSSVGIPTATLPERVLTGVWLGWLMAKCSAHNIAGTALRDLVSRTNTDLGVALHSLGIVAATDVLTTLPNRRSIVGILDLALEGRRPRDAGHGGRPADRVGVALFDLDHFKQVNDRCGHETGDEVLRVFGRLASDNLRPDDRVGRYGGEEFLLVLHRVRDARAAVEAADRGRREVADHDWSALSSGLAVTVSVGVALVEPGEDAATAIRRADAALYEAKRLGRDRVTLAPVTVAA